MTEHTIKLEEPKLKEQTEAINDNIWWSIQGKLT